ncbi:MAG: winged helix-turn-helix transcriptional regulator [Candidatus Marinimicrobia bacterium]|nr:winged helix-turn-helix transcriptional regulator [Candidatus Neomarinimicrobiota bacterium]
MRGRIDKIDIKLIHTLAENSRVTCRELAEKLSITGQRAARRLKKLEKAGIIRKYTIIPDFEKLNYVYASLGITLKPGAPVDEIIERLKKDKDVKVIERGIGNHDIILRVAIPKRLREMEDKIHEIVMKVGEVNEVDKTIITEIAKFEIL